MYTSTTLTSHSGSHMLIGARNMETLWAVNESTFSTSAVNIIQDDWANTKTKVRSDEGYCICWRVNTSERCIPIFQKHNYATDFELSTAAVDTAQ